VCPRLHPMLAERRSGFVVEDEQGTLELGDHVEATGIENGVPCGWVD
jgi:hypothetical protein